MTAAREDGTRLFRANVTSVGPDLTQADIEILAKRTDPVPVHHLVSDAEGLKVGMTRVGWVYDFDLRGEDLYAQCVVDGRIPECSRCAGVVMRTPESVQMLVVFYTDATREQVRSLTYKVKPVEPPS